jgi:peroxiredoxin
MKIIRFLFVGFLVVAFSPWSPAAEPGPRKEKEKSPADLAYDEISRLVGERDAKQDQARFQKIIAAGMNFIVAYPTHRRTLDVIGGLASYGANNLRAKGQGSLQASWLSLLEYEVLNYRLKEGLTDEARTAIAAMECAVAGIRVRSVPNKDNLETYREKIDTLTPMPGAGRFLESQESGYAEVLRYIKPAAGDSHLQKLLEHPDKKVATMAREELNLIEVSKTPYALKFTALDGREVDFAQLRGKVVLLWFWSAKSKNTDREHLGLQEMLTAYKKRGFEIVGVNCDKESDREAMAKFVKDNKVAWPQYFDGKDVKSDVASKLNVHSLPAAFVFDQKGMLVGGRSIKPEQLDSVLKRVYGVK